MEKAEIHHALEQKLTANQHGFKGHGCLLSFVVIEP